MAEPAAHSPEPAPRRADQAPALELRLADSPAEREKLMEQTLRQLTDARRQLQEDRADWELDAERQAESLALRSRQLLEREQGLASSRAALERREAVLQK